MKKILVLLVSVILAFGLAACGGSQGDFTWSREGIFSDENGNWAMITLSDSEGYEGMWAVTVSVGDEMHGWFIEQKGETLYGNLDTEYDDYEGDYIVTISEEGEDGIMIEVEGGETYHLAKEETPDVVATLQIHTDGLGTLAYGLEGEDVEFDEDFPNQSTVVNLTEPQTYVIKAKPDEGWKFVKWTKDGKDFSEEPEITVEVTEDVEYRAVFDVE